MKTQAYPMKHDKMTEADVVKATSGNLPPTPTPTPYLKTGYYVQRATAYGTVSQPGDLIYYAVMESLPTGECRTIIDDGEMDEVTATKIVRAVNAYEKDQKIKEALVSAAKDMDLTCLRDPLNPCSLSKTEKHWGGGEKCAPCRMTAALAQAKREIT